MFLALDLLQLFFKPLQLLLLLVFLALLHRFRFALGRLLLLMLPTNSHSSDNIRLKWLKISLTASYKQSFKKCYHWIIENITWWYWCCWWCCRSVPGLAGLLTAAALMRSHSCSLRLKSSGRIFCKSSTFWSDLPATALRISHSASFFLNAGGSFFWSAVKILAEIFKILYSYSKKINNENLIRTFRKYQRNL